MNGIRLTIDEFIEASRKQHGNKYDYSRVAYTNSKTKVEIVCPEHGIFWQQAQHHMNGRGCPMCGKLEAKRHQLKRSKRAGIEFESKARVIHGDRYDYSLVKYKRSNIAVRIVCPEHGEFLQKPSEHLAGCGCSRCGLIENSKNRTRNTQEFIELARRIHGDKYDYSKVDYQKATKEVEIICPVHGGFWQKPVNHLQGRGCWKCVGTYPLTTEDFIARATEVHNGLYDYSQTEYVNMATKVKIRCYKHGDFWQRPADHMYGRGCHLCQTSSGERRIAAYLDRLGIEHVSQKRFEACRTKKRHLPFDFYFKIGDINFLIEYDGQQHFVAVEMFGGESALLRTQRYDEIKNKFAAKYGFILIRIPYTDYDYLEDTLKQRIESYLGRPLLPISKQKRKHGKIKKLKGHQLSLLK